MSMPEFQKGKGWGVLWSDLYEALKRGLVFYRILITFVVGVGALISLFLVYTYDRSFLVHQATIEKADAWNRNSGIPFLYEIHTGHDGTTLKPVFPPSGGIKGADHVMMLPTEQPHIPIPITGGGGAVANSPLEQIDFINVGVPLPLVLVTAIFVALSLSLLYFLWLRRERE